MAYNAEKRWNFSPISKEHEREYFDCGYSILNDYLKKYARQNHQKGIARTVVALPISNPNKIEGYYTISSSVIEYQYLPLSFQKGIPAYPIPAILIGKLAVDNTAKGQGLGKRLLVDAFLKIIKISQEVGVFAVRVDAIDRTAKEFYLKYGFIPLQEQPLSLLLPITTILEQFS